MVPNQHLRLLSRATSATKQVTHPSRKRISLRIDGLEGALGTSPAVASLPPREPIIVSFPAGQARTEFGSIAPTTQAVTAALIRAGRRHGSHVAIGDADAAFELRPDLLATVVSTVSRTLAGIRDAISAHSMLGNENDQARNAIRSTASVRHRNAHSISSPAGAPLSCCGKCCHSCRIDTPGRDT